MIIIGITGSIGMGKTTVADLLREMSIPVHDSDAAVHFMLDAKGAAVAKVAQMFPEALKRNDESEDYIDREILGHIVFIDKDKKDELENYLHPLVKEASDNFKKQMAAKGHKIIGFDIPLLFETGGENRVDFTVCVSAPKEHQSERVLARPGMTSEKFKAIVSGQLTDAEKCKRANFVIKNDCDIEHARAQVKKVIDRIKLDSFDNMQEA